MTYFFRLSLFIVVTIFAHVGTTDAIVPECTFTGTSGFCVGMAGRFIRPEYDPNIRALYIVNCDLTALTSDDFARFQSLSTLHINNCKLPLTTYQNLLSDLKELRDLQITNSNLANDIKYMFLKNIRLNNLSLQSNKITKISKDTFSHLTQLETIDVTNNDISEVDQDAFVNLKHLKKLVLSKNKIGENFDPDSLSLSPEQCGVCGEICPVNATSSCQENEKTDHLWQAFEENYDIVFLEDNPICSTLGVDEASERTTDTDAVAGPASAGCVLLQGDACSKHEARRAFFKTACVQSGAPRRRSGRNHADDLSSAPEAEDGQGAGDLPESAPEEEQAQDEPPAPGTSGEAATEGGGQPDPSADDAAPEEESPSAADGADDADEGLPLSSVEVEEVHADSLSQFTSRSVLLGAIGGVVAAIGVGAALVVLFRTRRSYRSIQQNDEDSGKNELKVITSHESQAVPCEETTPFTSISTQ